VIPVVAIDGPSGAGKSTVARGAAEMLGLPVLDTGAMYRAVTLAVLEQGADPHDARRCSTIARDVALHLEDGVIVLDGRDVSAEIRGPEVTRAVSTVSAHPEVRAELVARQRAWVDEHGAGVVEGRDIGTVVFPEAAVKVFLTASEHERARRRQRDESDAERDVALEEVREELERRDRADSTRPVSPLAAADDAVVLDTTDLAVADIVTRIVDRYRQATEHVPDGPGASERS
jgi:CMP/dCMP kinase